MVGAENFEGTDLEFIPDKMVGLRSFRVDSLGRLTGISHQVIWTPGENQSVCAVHGGDPYSYVSKNASIPADKLKTPKNHSMKGCACGFYAYWDGSNTFSKSDTVTGIIEGYGEVLAGDKGFRSSKARIIGLALGRQTSKSPAFTFPSLLRRLSSSTFFNDNDAWFAVPTIAATVVSFMTMIMGLIQAFSGFPVIGGPLAIGGALLLALFTALVRTQYYAATSYMKNGGEVSAFDRVAKNYPDVKRYSSVKDMKKLLTPVVIKEPSPEDPDFWVREAK